MTRFPISSFVGTLASAIRLSLLLLCSRMLMTKLQMAVHCLTISLQGQSWDARLLRNADQRPVQSRPWVLHLTLLPAVERKIPFPRCCQRRDRTERQSAAYSISFAINWSWGFISDLSVSRQVQEDYETFYSALLIVWVVDLFKLQAMPTFYSLHHCALS